MDTYIKTKNTLSMLHYHFIFCPRYKRKIFNLPGVEQRFKEIINEECKKNQIDILAIECHSEYVYLFLSILPIMSPAIVMQRLKSTSSSILRNEIKELSSTSNLWTRNYLVSTAATVPSEVIHEYLNEQKKRG